MEFSWSDEHLSLRRSVIEFARAELNDSVRERDRDSVFSWNGWRKCADFGIHGLPIPTEYGGLGRDLLTTALVLESLGYACHDRGLVFSIGAHLLSCAMPLLAFGTEEQKRRYLPRLSTGQTVGVHAITEPEVGSDAFSLRTTAVRNGDRYVLNGRKTFITNGSIADLILVFATTARAAGPFAVTAFLVEKGAPGFSVGSSIEKMGLRSSPMAELVFDDCEVPAANRLGREGQGRIIFSHSMELERSCLLAADIGVMQRQLEQCVAYAKQRKQFGRPIGQFQSVSNRIAEMQLRLEAARLLLYKAAWLKSRNLPAAAEAAMAKLFVSEASVQSSLDAIRIHGGNGYTTEFEFERQLRDAVGGTIYSGTNDIQKLIIARSLGL